MVDDDFDDTPEESEDFGALTGGGSDSGMGNLPPLSDFDSSKTDSEGDEDLPPLDTPESGEDDDEGGISGLPPIVDIKVDTPAVRPSDLDTPEPKKPSKKDSGKGDENVASPAGFDTPGDLESPDPAQGLGFQDFAADSDFSPETPEIGPGPDSDIETPMFDSAFGGDSDVFGTPGGTSAPTQAMETPMFDTGGGDMGFDADASFGAATPDVGGPDAGTPVPDFSPDTGIPQDAPPPAPAKGGGLKTALLVVLFLIVGLAAGLFANPFVREFIPFLPNPDATTIEGLEGEIAQKDDQIRRLTAQDTGGEELTPAQIEELLQQRDELTQEIAQKESQADTADQRLAELRNNLGDVNSDIEIAAGLFVETQEDLEEIQNELTIADARFQGLLAENERLTEMVGQLEEADERRKATKDTLLHNIDLLAVQVKGGSPLTPARFDHFERINQVTELREKVQRAKWVSPQLLNEYTDLYLDELEISNAREYFFAKIPVKDNLGVTYEKWAECLMNGNWSVYFRTIDGNNVGSYENIAASGPAQYEFREDLPPGIRGDIVNEIQSARPENYQETIAVLKEKQAVYEPKTKFQRTFESF